MMATGRLVLLACAFAASASYADPAYVIEQLVVSVNSAPGGTGDKVASIRSGDRVELLDKQGDEAHIQLANGKEGWLKASYLSAEEPLQRRLSERTAEVEKLKQQITSLQADLTNARNALTGAAVSNSAAGSTSSDPPAGSASAAPDSDPAVPVPAPAIQDPTFFMTEPETPARPVWHWVVISSVLALGAGFGLGWWMLDRRIRRKYGGLRIY